MSDFFSTEEEVREYGEDEEVGFDIVVGGEVVHTLKVPYQFVRSVSLRTARGETGAVGLRTNDKSVELVVEVIEPENIPLNIRDEVVRQNRQRTNNRSKKSLGDDYVEADPETGEPKKKKEAKPVKAAAKKAT